MSIWMFFFLIFITVLAPNTQHPNIQYLSGSSLLPVCYLCDGAHRADFLPLSVQFCLLIGLFETASLPAFRHLDAILEGSPERKNFITTHSHSLAPFPVHKGSNGWGVEIGLCFWVRVEGLEPICNCESYGAFNNSKKKVRGTSSTLSPECHMAASFINIKYKLFFTLFISHLVLFLSPSHVSQLSMCFHAQTIITCVISRYGLKMLTTTTTTTTDASILLYWHANGILSAQMWFSVSQR